jgi:hypothetical protein
MHVILARPIWDKLSGQAQEKRRKGL